jgi:phosphatidate cytidylyltransferase
VSNLIIRVLTAVVGIPLVVGLIYLGGWVFLATVLVISLVAQHELYRMAETGGIRPFTLAGLLGGALLVTHHLWPPALFLALLVPLGLLLALPLLRSVTRPLEQVSVTFAGMIYPTLLLSFLVALRGPEAAVISQAFWITLALFILVWTADTAAYFAGRGFGRHPLAPRVSPKKTWEGSIGGVLGAFLVALLLKVSVMPFLGWVDVLVLTLITGVASQLGDLAQSTFKREMAVKDSGSLLPGHGGLLDRFDGMILAAPLTYLYLQAMSMIGV